MIFGILLFLFIVVCIFLCLLILFQSDKGGGLTSAIGGLSGASNFLGTQDAANVLTKGTYIFGGVFLALCLLMTFFEAGGGGVEKSGLQKRAEAMSVTPMPASGMGGFVDEDPAPAEPPASAGDGPVIVGGIVEGGVEKEFVDGELRPVEKKKTDE